MGKNSFAKITFVRTVTALTGFFMSFVILVAYPMSVGGSYGSLFLFFLLVLGSTFAMLMTGRKGAVSLLLSFVLGNGYVKWQFGEKFKMLPARIQTESDFMAVLILFVIPALIFLWACFCSGSNSLNSKQKN